MERLCPSRPPWEFHRPLESGRSSSQRPARTSDPDQQHQFGPQGFSLPLERDGQGGVRRIQGIANPFPWESLPVS